MRAGPFHRILLPWVALGLFGPSAMAQQLQLSPPIEAYSTLPPGSHVGSTLNSLGRGREGVHDIPDGISLSPDGKNLAVISQVEGESGLLIVPLEGGGQPIPLLLKPYAPTALGWKSDQKLLVRLEAFADDGSNGYGARRMVVVDADGQTVKQLGPTRPFFPGTALGINHLIQEQATLVSRLPDDPDHILLGMTESERPYLSVQKVDLQSGQGHVQIGAREDMVRWFADAHGIVRFAFGPLHPKSLVVVTLARDDKRGAQDDKRGGQGDKKGWHEINRRDEGAGDPRFVPVAVAEDDSNHLYVLSDRDRTGLALRLFDLARNDFVAEVAARSDGRDVEVWVHDNRLIAYSDPANPGKRLFVDKAWGEDEAAAEQALPNKRLKIIDRLDKGQKALFVAQKDNQPTSYWLLDRSGDQPRLTEISRGYSKISDEQVAPVSQVAFEARDGLSIPAFLTLPLGSSPGPIPFVVLPHGGPASHDSADHFDYLVQFLASRGYGVLQPQFRGSTGFGPAFQKAGQGQWGLAMQDDVTDATLWLIKQNLAQPGRIAIVGASYGGYAALMAGVKEPSLYAAIAAYAPITDLVDWRERLRRSYFGLLHEDNLPRDTDLLKAGSPARHADQLVAPVLLMHGRKDYVVPVDQSETMEAALKGAGKSAQVIYLSEADHFLSHSADRQAFLSALEPFLAAHLGGGAGVKPAEVSAPNP